MTKEEAIKWLIKPTVTSTEISTTKAKELEAYNTAIEALKSEQPKGEWINDIRYPGWTCTHCSYHDGNRTDNFCPNCGASMRRGENE